MRSMSDVLRETGIDNISLLKVDVEGRDEMDVLAGIAKDDWAKIRQIVMEIHDADGERVAQTRSRLESQGFRCLFEQEVQFRESGIVICYAFRDR